MFSEVALKAQNLGPIVIHKYVIFSILIIPRLDMNS